MVTYHLLDNITQQFLTPLQHDAHVINRAAKTVFYYLVVIQLTISTLWMLLAGEQAQQFFSKLVQLMFTFAVYYSLIRYGGQWIPALLNGFIRLGQQGGVTSIDPSSIFAQGLMIAGSILHAMGTWGRLFHPMIAFLAVVLTVGIAILYALIAAELVVILVKAYIVVAIGGLFFAFGASEFTRVMMRTYFQKAIGLGLQLMTLYLLIGVGQHIGRHWPVMVKHAEAQHNLIPMLLIGGVAIVYYIIIHTIPAFVASFSGVGGFRNYGATTALLAMQSGMMSANYFKKAAMTTGSVVGGLYGVAGRAMGMAGWSRFATAATGWYSGGMGGQGQQTQGYPSPPTKAAGNTVRAVNKQALSPWSNNNVS